MKNKNLNLVLIVVTTGALSACREVRPTTEAYCNDGMGLPITNLTLAEKCCIADGLNKPLPGRDDKPECNTTPFAHVDQTIPTAKFILGLVDMEVNEAMNMIGGTPQFKFAGGSIGGSDRNVGGQSAKTSENGLAANPYGNSGSVPDNAAAATAGSVTMAATGGGGAGGESGATAGNTEALSGPGGGNGSGGMSGAMAAGGGTLGSSTRPNSGTGNAASGDSPSNGILADSLRQLEALTGLGGGGGRGIASVGGSGQAANQVSGTGSAAQVIGGAANGQALNQKGVTGSAEAVQAIGFSDVDPAATTLDPRNYFGLIGKQENLFQRVSERYSTKARVWVQNEATTPKPPYRKSEPARRK